MFESFEKMLTYFARISKLSERILESFERIREMFSKKSTFFIRIYGLFK
jgi:hypothetical protein